MKKHLVDLTIGAEDLAALNTGFAGLEGSFASYAFTLDDAERKRLQRLGLRNETFTRAVLDVAKQNPSLVPATIDLAALERDLVAREQVLPFLFRARHLTRLFEDTAIALGVDMYNGARGLYKTMKVTAEISGMSDVVAGLGERFAAQGRRKQQPAPDDVAAPSQAS